MTSLLHRLGSAVLAVTAAGLIACGDSDPAPAPAPAPAPGGPYAIGGTVTGLPSGGELKLRNNGADELTVSGNGTFAFAAKLASGATYAVTISTQPANGTCAVTTPTGSGTVSAADVTSVAITCVETFTIGGTVTGLAAGGSVVLGAGAAGNATVTAEGAFTLPTRLAGGDTYEITVTTQPTGQNCAVTNGTGTVAAVSVTNVAISCTYTTQWVYVLNHGSDSITRLGIDSVTRAITRQSPDLTAQDGPLAITTDPAGTLAVIANNVAQTITVHRINGVTGALTAVGSPAGTAGLNPRSIAVSGGLVFVAATDGAGRSLLLTYVVDTAAGTTTLTNLRDLPGPGVVTSVDVNGQGTLVMATVDGPGTVSMFRIERSLPGLTEIAGSPFVVGPSPRAAKFNAAGTLAFVAEASSDSVAVYGVSATGELAPKAGSPFATGGTSPSALALDATNTFVYVTNGGSNNVSSFALDPVTGALTAAPGSPFATGAAPHAVAVDRSSSIVFVSNRTDSTVSAFRVAETGSLSPIAGSPFTTGTEPAEIAFGP